MKDTLLYLLQNIVDNKDALSIDEVEEEGRIVFVVHSAQEDIGKIIGKHGRIIRALRDLIKIIAVKQNAYVDIRIAE
jgi:predicted RNA-binding protein YlqC (UPF0109 family)